MSTITEHNWLTDDELIYKVRTSKATELERELATRLETACNYIGEMHRSLGAPEQQQELFN